MYLQQARPLRLRGGELQFVKVDAATPILPQARSDRHSSRSWRTSTVGSEPLMGCVVGFRHAAFLVKTQAPESRPYNVVSSLVFWSHGVVRGRICLSLANGRPLNVIVRVASVVRPAAVLGEKGTEHDFGHVENIGLQSHPVFDSCHPIRAKASIPDRYGGLTEHRPHFLLSADMNSIEWTFRGLNRHHPSYGTNKNKNSSVPQSCDPPRRRAKAAFDMDPGWAGSWPMGQVGSKTRRWNGGDGRTSDGSAVPLYARLVAFAFVFGVGEDNGCMVAKFLTRQAHARTRSRPFPKLAVTFMSLGSWDEMDESVELFSRVTEAIVACCYFESPSGPKFVEARPSQEAQNKRSQVPMLVRTRVEQLVSNSGPQ
ncbi:hypothetical protein BDP67DRAFT_496756 [Colletotrichum lupini]|nr:hypothetical protein BDP67DRAFT_496756 [Colletotrichum lupini]